METKTEFLFNILMANNIPFIRFGKSHEFILLEEKIRIATFESDFELFYTLYKNKYKDLVFVDGVIPPSLLAKILNINYINMYSKIFI